MNDFLSCVIICCQNEPFPAEPYSAASSTFQFSNNSVSSVEIRKYNLAKMFVKKQIEITSYLSS